MAKSESKRLISIKPTTWALFQGSFASVIGLGVAILYSLRGTIKVAANTDSVLTGMAFGLAAGIISIIVLPLVYFAFGWLVGLVQAWVYNTILGISGGVVFHTTDDE